MIYLLPFGYCYPFQILLQYWFCLKKRSMIEESFDQLFPSASISKIHYSQSMIMIEDDSQLLLAFVKQLTFQPITFPSSPLMNEEVEKLKTIIDKLHSHAKRHKLTLKEIQGIWPLLSIMFTPINGLQLYLEFQKLLMPIIITQVKQEQGQFSPNGYFQENNDWKNDKNLMSALRILERTLVKGSYEKSKQEIYRFYELIAVDKADYLIVIKDFENRLEQFRRKAVDARKLQYSNKLTNLLSDRFFEIKGPTSEPDLLTNTLKIFSLREIEDIHDTKTNKIVPIIQEDLQQDSNEISPAKQSETMSPPKRKHPIGCSDTTKIPKQRLTKNNTRFFYAKKFFELEKKQNIVLSEMKNKKALINRQRKRRSKLQKMTSKSRKANYYHSDEEEQIRKMTKKRICSGELKERDEYIFDYESEVYSASDQMFDRCDDEEISEEPAVKRNSKFYKKIHTIDSYFEMDVEEDYPINTKRFFPDGAIHQTLSENRQKQNMGKYKRDYIKLMQAEEPIKTSQKIINLEIRLLITVGGENLSSDFDFWRYRRYLQTLQGKQISREAHKIMIELINRESVAFDKSILLKILTFFTLSMEKQRNQPEWKFTRDKYLRIALKFSITSNIYRGICEIINCFFDRNEDEATLLKAKEYFKILAEYVQAFKHVNLQQQISQMIFEALLTPKRYRKFKDSFRFTSEAELAQFTSPFLIARKALKYHLTQHQELIAYLIGQFALISLTLEKFFYDSCISLQKQKQYFSQLQAQLLEMKNDSSCSLPFSFRTAAIQMKNFYLMYRPRLNDNYLKGLVNFFHLSFDQLLIKSIKEETEEEAKEHIEFAAAVFQDFIEKEFSKSPPAMGANVYSRLMKTQTKLKQTYQNKKQANVALLFSTIFSLFLKWPQFRAANLGKQLMGTFRSTVLFGLQNNLYKLKPALYSPILNCLYDLYSYKVELFLKVDHLQATEKQEYQPIRSIISSVWDKLSQNYRSCFQELEVTIQQKNNRNEGRSKGELIIPKLRRCESGFILFLKLFMLDGACDRPNFPRQSYSHRYYCLQFILRQQHFIKFFQNATSYPQYSSKQFITCIIDVLQRWFFFFPTIDFFFDKYSAIIMDLRRYYSNYEQKRAMEFSLLSEVKDSGIQQSLANIYATQLIVTIIDHSEKGKQINFLENPVLKVIDQNTDPTLTSFAKISKSVHLFDHFLNRIIRFFEIEQLNLNFLQEQAKYKIKKAFYDFIKEKFIKKITMLIMLAALARNSYEYETIPLSQIVQNLKKLRLFDQKNLVEQKIPFQCQLFFQEGIEKIQIFTGIQQVFAEIIRWRNQSVSQQRNKRALEGFKVLFQDLYSCVKKLSSERQKKAIPVEWMKWATFAMQWPEILNHQKLLKDRAHLSEFKINTNSIKVLLTLMQVVDSRTENIYRIKEISQVFTDNLCRNLLQREEQLCKQVRGTLMCIRQCLEEKEALTQAGKKLVQKIVSAFCDPEKLINLNSGLARLRLQIYFQMMEGSERERQGYQSLLINNYKQFIRLVPRHMKGYNNLKRQPCDTIENLILSCMIGKHSSLFDVKRLLTGLKNSNSVLCSSKKALYSQLFHRLQAQAEESQSLQLASWCKDQITQIQSYSLADWMDIE